ncbi:type II toxin-antitoxin system VapC family toxin [Microbacterium sufflavum]|uniref:Ribonuclease VapC n=1 Tax=Microbacterium sufflavum TaxID=2851649 RepID=A0ABY4IC49_9MICO|nr:type II toxin-antitoxin system VapC family toxin [Microbacterium sufflavum]UPL09880.1 type II toxin-antitoxin system VapC family toxin [Microbacterium sufflavum]
MIYLDSCILIYALEDRGTSGAAVRRALAKVDIAVASSALALQECLVRPLRERNAELRDRYLAMFEHIETVDLDAPVFVRAAELRADFGIKTPDALHLAAAQLSGCTELWTNDKRLAAASHGLAVDVLAGLPGE